MDVISAHVLRIIIIILIAILVWVVTQLLTRSFIVYISVGTAKGQRLRTLTSLVRSTISVVIASFALVMILWELGVTIAPVLASAGIVGLAIGFGAQTLVKDVISGLFILIENQFGEGDEVEIADKKGVVEKITLRTVWLKDEAGAVHIIPNGSIVVVSNFSKHKN